MQDEKYVFSGPLYEYSVSLQYQPNPCWTGRDSFEVRALDADGNLWRAVISLEVTDAPPQLKERYLLVQSVDGEPVTFELPAATAAPPYTSADLTYGVIRGPLHGVLQGSGREYTFIPDRAYCGFDFLEYVVTDPCGARSYGCVEFVIFISHPFLAPQMLMHNGEGPLYSKCRFTIPARGILTLLPVRDLGGRTLFRRFAILHSGNGKLTIGRPKSPARTLQM